MPRRKILNIETQRKEPEPNSLLVAELKKTFLCLTIIHITPCMSKSESHRELIKHVRRQLVYIYV